MAQNTVHLLIFASDLFRKNFTKLNHHKCLYFYVNNEIQRFKPCHEIMALFILRNLILQTHMHSHPVGLDVLFLVGPFVYYHTSCVRTVKALARLRMHRLRAGSPEPSLVPYVISTIISWAGSFISLDLSIIGKTLKITYLQQLFSPMVCLLLCHCLYVIVRQCHVMLAAGVVYGLLQYSSFNLSHLSPFQWQTQKGYIDRKSSPTL